MRKLLATASVLSIFIGVNNVTAQEQDIMQFAQETARIAGGARYCKLDDEKIEAFITRSLGAIARLARDETEKAIARIEFKNNLDVAGAQRPEEGCNSFSTRFDRIIQQ
jgi:predicted transglutaminase-like cysteine proteinase